MARRILLLMQALCIFGVMVWFHDDGRLEALPETDQSYVLQQSKALEDRMKDVIDGMRRFVAEPDRESEVSDALVDAINSWGETYIKIHGDKRFFVEFEDDRNRKQQGRLAEQNIELEFVADEMIEELCARKDRGEYDQEAYDRLAIAFSKPWWTSRGSPNGVCDQRKCIWCFFQRVIFK